MGLHGDLSPKPGPEPAARFDVARARSGVGETDRHVDGDCRGAERKHIGDLQAVRARSRVTEAAALTDPAGLGGFAVLEWR